MIFHEYDIENLTEKSVSQPKVVVVQSLDENNIHENYKSILVKPETNPYYEDESNKNNTKNRSNEDESFEKIKIVGNIYYQ